MAIDGSKFRAAASPNRVLDARRIAEEAAKFDAQIAHYLANLNEVDANETGEDANTTAVALAVLKERRAELDRLSGYLGQDARTLVVDGELDARPMGFAWGGKPPSYNVQIAVDADTGIVIHHEVTDEVNDIRMLYPMAKAAKELLGEEGLTVVADAGYSNGTAAADCEAEGITPCVPVKRSVNNRGDGDLFDRSYFTYNADHDNYTCPSGRILHRKGARNRASFFYVSRDCSSCNLKSSCTQAEYRWVSRRRHEDAFERMTARVAESPELMRQRRRAAEHPFGTMKRMMSGRFLTRGIKGTSIEMALSVLAYNMIRSINLWAN